MELAVHQIIGRDHAAEPFDSYRPGQAVDAGESHQDRHCAIRFPGSGIDPPSLAV